MTPPAAPERSPLRPVTGLWYLLVLLSALALGFGLYAYSIQLERGDIATGLRNPGNGGAAWGFYIVFYVYFVGVSFAGITVASLARLFHIETLKPVTRLAELLTIVALIVGALMVLADLGRPLDGLQKLPMLARPSSPFYGTFTLVVSGYLFSSLVFFILAARRDAATMARTGPRLLRPLYRLWASGFREEGVAHARHWRTSYWLALTILPLLVIAHSTLGFIFGIQSGRPGWFSALQAPAFVVLAGVSGTGMLILFALLARSIFRIRDLVPEAAIRWLGTFLWVLAAVYLYFIIVEELTSTYAAPRADRTIAHEVVEGTFSTSFWVAVGCLFGAFLIPFVMYLRKGGSLGWLAVAALLANVAAVVKRLLIVVPSQTHGGLLRMRQGVYTPTWVEAGVVIGGAGMLGLAILVFGRYFPLVPSHVTDEQRHTPVPRDPLRSIVSLVWLFGSLALIIFGLGDSFRLWSHGELDPRVPFSPAIFATGVILLFSTAIVYEAFPARRRTPPARVAKPPPRATLRRKAMPPRVDVRAQFRSSRDRRIRRTS
ncbi:MAG: polysulfide reductase NrfD [Kofleriaceae bacterium]|nr:polysulfide reductase NrfD [Myxococcales bacterium]MCB9564490.1 polysulfide reductase NrfD [Kofleriaceae bacterium]MCB9573915.1 polysulfide reductase NrfD [Kofleriaceae bacterium]